MPNRLASETSLYLLQHQNNPVDWYPWGDEAFARAVELGRRVFLSVGYSSCHWCHVMEHECFEDEQVAELLNANFVCVKVDREERPDVDEAFMMAIQMMSSRGGWPMSVFLTPDRKPFYGGTYFPKEDRSGHPGFMTICRQIASAWNERREDLLAAAEELSLAVSNAFTSQVPPANHGFNQATCDAVVTQVAADFDATFGGFGKAPKFPPHTALEFLFAYVMRESSPDELVQSALGMGLTTLVRMCFGGIRDHVGGGFHRYSTDERWVLSHFEKMLYDNALMLSNLVKGSLVAADFDPATSEFLRAAADELVDWLMTEMRSPEGMFYSAIDADSEGVEGKFYVWTETELRSLLGDRAEAFIRSYGVQPHGNFAEESTGDVTGDNVLYIGADLDGDFSGELEILRKAREKRVMPSLDTKCVVGWNGLAIDALALAGHLGPAAIAALAILQAEEGHGRLPRLVTNGKPVGEGFLEDYAYFANSLFKIAGLTGLLEEEKVDLGGLPSQTFWVSHAARLTEVMVELFFDESQGGFFSVSDRHELLFGASKPVFDQPVPSANAIAIRCLVEMGDGERAGKSLTAMLGWMERAPQATEALYTTAMVSLLDAAEVEPSGGVPEASIPQVLNPTDVKPQVTKLASPYVEVKLVQREIAVDSTGWATGMVSISIPEGFHLNSPKPIARWIVPTAIKIRPLESEVSYPETIDDSYEGQLYIAYRVRLPDGKSGDEYEVKVSYQACTNQECLAAQSITLNGVVVRS